MFTMIMSNLINNIKLRSMMLGRMSRRDDYTGFFEIFKYWYRKKYSVPEMFRLIILITSTYIFNKL